MGKDVKKREARSTKRKSWTNTKQIWKNKNKVNTFQLKDKRTHGRNYKLLRKKKRSSKNVSAIPRHVTNILFTALFVRLPGQKHNKIMFDNVCDTQTPNPALWPLKVPINSGLWLALVAEVRAWLTAGQFLSDCTERLIVEIAWLRTMSFKPTTKSDWNVPQYYD